MTLESAGDREIETDERSIKTVVSGRCSIASASSQNLTVDFLLFYDFMTRKMCSLLLFFFFSLEPLVSHREALHTVAPATC